QRLVEGFVQMGAVPPTVQIGLAQPQTSLTEKARVKIRIVNLNVPGSVASHLDVGECEQFPYGTLGTPGTCGGSGGSCHRCILLNACHHDEFRFCSVPKTISSERFG